MSQRSSYRSGPSPLLIEPSQLEIPYDRVSFKGKAYLRLTNLGQYSMAFKIRASNSSNYEVRPPTQMLQPGQSIEVVVMLSARLNASTLSSYFNNRVQLLSKRVASLSEMNTAEFWQEGAFSSVLQVSLVESQSAPSSLSNSQEVVVHYQSENDQNLQQRVARLKALNKQLKAKCQQQPGRTILTPRNLVLAGLIFFCLGLIF